MTPTITPHAAMKARRAAREAEVEYRAAVAAFRAAMNARRAAARVVEAFPVLDFRVTMALAALAEFLSGGAVHQVNVAHRAWNTRPVAPALTAWSKAGATAEIAAGRVFDARCWYQQTRKYVRAIDRGDIAVVKGAAWSQRGLCNVQLANRNR